MKTEDSGDQLQGANFGNHMLRSTDVTTGYLG